MKYKGTLSYILCVVLVNVAFTRLPFFHLLGGQYSIGDVLVGSIYVMRDFAQREIGHRVIIAMLFAAILSYLLADPMIAKASLAAFIVGESIDWGLFTFTKKPLSERLLISSIMSTPLDTYVFLYMMQRVNWLEFSLMTLGKFAGVFMIWYSWRRQQMQIDNLQAAQPSIQ